jgi:hypothetical protein
MKLIAIFYLFLLFSFSFNVNAQQTPIDSTLLRKSTPLTGSLAEQYVEVVVRSGSYKVYKNIKKTKIEELWKNVNDSLNLQKQLLAQATSNPKNNAQIDSLKAKIDDLENSKPSIISAVNGKSLSIYHWLVFFGLIIAIVFALIRTRVAVKEANYRNELYDQLFEELREQRIKATEREKKLGRELQTERNLVEELLEKRKKTD